MSIINLTSTQLRKAADLKDQIAGLETELAAILGSETKAAHVVVSEPAKRKMSAAHIAKIRAAQKLRWAKVNAAKAKTAPKAAPKPAAKPNAAQVPKNKGGMSAEGRARIIAAQKARWAKIKAAKIVPAAKPAAVVKLVSKAVVAPKTADKPAKKKFVMSAAAKAKISAAAKARWAKIKAGKK